MSVNCVWCRPLLDSSVNPARHQDVWPGDALIGVSMDVIGCHHLPIVTVFSCCLLKLCIFYWCAGIICFSVVLKMHEITLPLHTSVVTSFCYDVDFQLCRGVY